jgi:uncharacterized OB-fold protein
MPDGLDAPFWAGTRRHELVVQRCAACGTWQWGPEWLCHACHAFDPAWVRVDDTGGVVYSWERVWHPVHPALADACPYVVLLVELPAAGGIRMVGNRVGDPLAPVVIGEHVVPVFEDHDDAEVPYTLVQWAVAPR